MPRGQYDRTKSRAAAALAVLPKNQILPSEVFSKLSGWDKLSDDEQKAVHFEGEKLAHAMLNYGMSRLAIGEHLAKLRDILEPHNLFSKFLRGFTLNKRTAYRYIAGYENAKMRLPEAIMKVAMARGMNIIGDTAERPLGIYTNAVNVLPPPQNPDNIQANTYLDQLDNVRKQQRTTETQININVNPDDLLKETYRVAAKNFRKLPNNHKTRANWINHLCSFLLAELGVSSAQTIKPLAVPEGYRAQRGRPTTQSTAA